MTHHLWCVRHGERIEDAQHAIEQKCAPNRAFDLPLSSFGVDQAASLGHILQQTVFSAEQTKPKYIYTSPMLRMIQTSFELCKILKADMVIVPSLSFGAHIVNENGLQFMGKTCNLALAKQYIENVESIFLPKQDILSRFSHKEFNIHFIDVIHANLTECIQQIMEIDKRKNNADSTITICVTHREKNLNFQIDTNRFKVQKNMFGIVRFKRKKERPMHCEMFKYIEHEDSLWYDGKLEDE